MSKLKDRADIEKAIAVFKSHTMYTKLTGASHIIPLTYDWWIANKDKGFKTYFTEFYKTFYATYFDIHALAKEIDKQLFDTKVIKAGNILVIDTVGANPSHLFSRIQKLKDNDYSTIIIYLEVDPEMCIARDKYREETQGRGIGESVIMGYAKNMASAVKAYKDNAVKPDGIIDRIIHLKWKPTGDSPIKGDWQLVSDDKYFIKRKINKMKGENE